MIRFNSHKIEHSITLSSIDDDDYRIWKESLMDLFEKKHQHRFLSRSFFETRNIFDAWNIERQQENFSSWIGMWSKFFIQHLCKNKLTRSDCQKDFLMNLQTNFWVLKNSDNKIENAISDSFFQTEFFYQKQEKHNKLSQFISKNKDFYSGKYKQKLLNDNIYFFKEVIDHFKNNVYPYVENLVSRKDFEGQINELPTIKHSFEYPTLRLEGEFDFYDLKENMIVNFKFDKQEKIQKRWIFKSLFYIYQFEAKYKDVGICGIKIINTFHGIEFKATLDDLFGENGKEKFLKISKQEIPDRDKKSFKTNLQNFWYAHTEDGAHLSEYKSHFGADYQEQWHLLETFIEDLFSKIKDENELTMTNDLWKKWIQWQDDHS